MTTAIKLVQGDTKPSLNVTLLNEDTNTPINLTGATIVMYFRESETVTLLDTLVARLQPDRPLPRVSRRKILWPPNGSVENPEPHLPQSELIALDVWDNPNLMLNIEYVNNTTNVQSYDEKFLVIHGLKSSSKTQTGKRIIKDISVNESELNSLVEKHIVDTMPFRI